jgi:hypothetical protein
LIAWDQLAYIFPQAPSEKAVSAEPGVFSSRAAECFAAEAVGELARNHFPWTLVVFSAVIILANQNLRDLPITGRFRPEGEPGCCPKKVVVIGSTSREGGLIIR